MHPPGTNPRRSAKYRPMLKAPAEPALVDAAAAVAASRGITLAKLVREAVRRELQAPEQATPLKAPLLPALRLVEPDPGRTSHKRYSVRLPQYVADASAERAAAVGIRTVSRWLTALAQSNVSTATVLADEEIRALYANLRELRMIGSNINQIAHSLNSALLQMPPVTVGRIEILSPLAMEKIGELKQQIAATDGYINTLIVASRNAWGSQ